ncbi:MFS transporter [Streptomyces sp. Agncl-13]|uniref:MFS transporter n=1 Tax=Streptomyces sp. Agncl-13 TaxID=3400628 RepID=UPI003A8559B8
MTERRRSALIGPVLVLATLVSSIISSFGAPLIPTVAREFHESLSTAQWSLTVALLVGAASSPVLGRLGDGPRRRATLLGGLTVVTAGGAVAALAGGLGMLLVGRGLQGVGLGLAPLAMATARDELPQAEVAPMIALLSVSAGAGLGAGYPISGVIAETWGLAGAYWFGAIVSGLALICVAAVVPSNAGRSAPDRLDRVGTALLVLALVTTLVAVAEGHSGGGVRRRSSACRRPEWCSSQHGPCSSCAPRTRWFNCVCCAIRPCSPPMPAPWCSASRCTWCFRG